VTGDKAISLIATHRPAKSDEAMRLFELRRRSIIALAPKGISIPQAESWAASLTVHGMERKVREIEVWVAELDGQLAGWGAIRDDRLEGLYVDPEFAGQGIGSGLLAKLEGLIRVRDIGAIRAEVSSNAETFYLRRGYEPVAPRISGEARLVAKRLT
jgi:putative acetyltransferase